MDDFARLPAGERRLYFEQASANLNLSPQIVEKDFWVCWILRRLFSLDEVRDRLTFKGGTSLSKAYRIIERFSEDVDIAIEREHLGFGGEQDPMHEGISGKEQQRRIARLKQACQEAVANRILPQLEEAIATILGEGDAWELSLDTLDPDRQTLLFQFPPAVTTGLSPYFSASVKIELGARSDHFPVEIAPVSPYLSEAIPGAIQDTQVQVRVLSAVRTFWEKATILHMLHHQPMAKKIAPRMSRHYYDVFQLSNSPVWEQALKGPDLLKAVAEFKDVFFKSSWAKYKEARPGTLALVPGEQLAEVLQSDYLAMQPMFFSTPPEFEQILAHLLVLESQINELT